MEPFALLPNIWTSQNQQYQGHTLNQDLPLQNLQQIPQSPTLIQPTYGLQTSLPLPQVQPSSTHIFNGNLICVVVDTNIFLHKLKRR